MTNEQILEAVNEVLGNVARKGTNEHRLIETMEEFPRKYDFGDCSVHLEIKIRLEEGWIRIYREHGHCSATPFAFRFHAGGWGGQEPRIQVRQLGVQRRVVATPPAQLFPAPREPTQKIPSTGPHRVDLFAF